MKCARMIFIRMKIKSTSNFMDTHTLNTHKIVLNGARWWSIQVINFIIFHLESVCLKILCDKWISADTAMQSEIALVEKTPSLFIFLLLCVFLWQRGSVSFTRSFAANKNERCGKIERKRWNNANGNKIEYMIWIWFRAFKAQVEWLVERGKKENVIEIFDGIKSFWEH